MNRFDVERALDRAALPGPAKGIMRVITSKINHRSGQIESRHSPSIATIARESGYHPATVCRHLARLEREGWLTRHRWPSWSMAITENLPTHYAVHIPAAYRDNRPSQSATAPDLGERQGAIAERGPGYRAERDIQSETPSGHQSSSPDDDDQLREIATREIAELTGRRVSDHQAAEIVRLVLEGREVRNRAAYLRRAIRAEPARFAPAPSGPPPFAELRAAGLA